MQKLDRNRKRTYDAAEIIGSKTAGLRRGSFARAYVVDCAGRGKEKISRRVSARNPLKTLDWRKGREGNGKKRKGKRKE